MTLIASGQQVKWAVKGKKVIVTVPKRFIGSTEALAFQLNIEK